MSINLAAALALKDRRLLLIDRDSQARAFLSLGISRTNLHPFIADAILAGRGLTSLIRKSGAEGLDIKAKTKAKMKRTDIVRALIGGLMSSGLDLTGCGTAEDIAEVIKKRLKEG